MAQICEKTNSNIKDIALGMGLDSRIGNKFLNAGMGYGGSCFAKDLSALIDLCIDNCINPNLLTAVQDINTNQIERLVDKIEEKLNPCINKTIGILGLSFKPNTDDLRDAPSIKLINKLLEKQFIIKAHDPIINGKIKNILPDIQLIKDESNQEENIYLLSENIDAIVIVTEWEIYKKIDWFKIKKLMKTPIIFDGRNILNGKEMESMGFEYYGVGN
jgi:UDPglucose 6-dehydrogenase